MTTADHLSLEHRVRSVDELRALYRPPTEAVATKKADHIAPWARAFITVAPLALLATADGSGRPTVSPRGGAPGFAAVLDDRHLAIPDFAGNNLLDSLHNLVENPDIGVLFMLPGRGETVRVDGRALITTAPRLLDRWVDGSRRPKAAIVIEAREVFVHCSASLTRSQLWAPASWRDDGHLPYRDFVIEELRRTCTPADLPEWAR